jgi:prepilin-type N-terminal cleavage/methylation domain-containing protein
MTSTVRSFDLRRGFTLLEITIVLLISTLVLAGAVGLMTYSSDEHALKKASRELEGLAKRARATAILHQTPYALVFQEGSVQLMPWSEAYGDKQDLSSKESAKDDAQESMPAAVHWELSLDQGMQSAVRRWNAQEWILVNKKVVHVWRFDPNGLCEPISLRLSLDKSSMTIAFHPLTGAIRESDIEIL